MGPKPAAVLGALALIAVVAAGPAFAEPQSLKRISEAPNGDQANGESYGASLSRDGNLVTFASDASNLVSGPTSGSVDVYLYRADRDELELLTRDRSGGPANNASGGADISANGRYVAFSSAASDLVAGDDNKRGDVFVLDRKTGKNEVVSVSRKGVLGDRDSSSPRISSNGRYVAFDSKARNLSRFPDTNKKTDVFVHDRKSGTTNRVSVSSKGSEANDHSFVAGVSNDGTRVAFVSFASNLVPLDTNEFGDAFVYDRETQKTTRVSVSSSENQSAQGGIATDLSPDGRFAVFYSSSPLVPDDTNDDSDVFVRDLETDETERISVSSDETQANAYSHNEAQISADGCLVTFDSGASNLVDGDTNNSNDVFVRNRCKGTTTRLSLMPDGTESNGDSTRPHISADGTRVAFATEATNLDGQDTNEYPDIFLARR